MTPMFYEVMGQSLSSDEMIAVGEKLGVYVSQGPPSSMGRTLFEGARMRVRLDALFNEFHARRSQIDLTPHIYELIAVTLTAEQMINLCRHLGLDSLGLGLDAGSLIGWGYDNYLQRSKAKVAQDNSETAELLKALQTVKPELDLSAFGKIPEPPPPVVKPEPEAGRNGPRPTRDFQFENFDLIVTRDRAGYRIDARSQGGGDSANDIQLNIIEDEKVLDLLDNLDNLIGTLDQAETVGKIMRERLFPSDIWAYFRVAQRDALNGNGSGIRIRLQIEPPEIGLLPWEYCFDEDFGFLALDPGLPMVRFIQQPYTAENILAPRPTRVLLASATPSGFSDVSADEETELISTELEALVEEGVIELHYLKHLTSEKLQEELIDFNPHIFHFIGHGTFDLDSEKGALILEREDGRPRELSSRQLGQLLRGKEVKIIILNACKTAAHGGNNAFMGLAPALVKARVPAVIAMQYAMPDRTAPLFARQIYKYLTKGLPLDRAITEARINLFTSGDENIFWAIPVLFMRAKDGVIWQEHRN